jgi:transposase
MMRANGCKGRKRHIVTDTIGLLIGLVVYSAGIQDRDVAPDVLKSIAARYPSLRHVFADGGEAGPKLRDPLKALGRWTIRIVKRSDTAEGFERLPRRWGGRPHLRLAEQMSPLIERLGKNPSQVPRLGSSVVRYRTHQTRNTASRNGLKRFSSFYISISDGSL